MGLEIIFKTKYSNFIILVLINYSLANDLRLIWPTGGPLAYSVVIISVKNKPVSTGVIISETLILSSANPIEREEENVIKIHVIGGSARNHTTYEVERVIRDQAKRNTWHWSTIGFDNRHAPRHDIVVIQLKESLPLDPNIVYENNKLPFAITMSNKVRAFRLDEHFTYVGFGFVEEVKYKDHNYVNEDDGNHLNDDENKTEKNAKKQKHRKGKEKGCPVKLEMFAKSVEIVEDDCLEWIPGEWGNFICLKNEDKYAGISSGAPLFYKNKLVGLGAFSVDREQDSVLVFTDCRKYKDKLIYD